MKIQITKRLLGTYPDSKFVAILAQDFTNEKHNQYLEKEREKVHQKIQKIEASL